MSNEKRKKKLAEWAGFTEIIQLGSCLCGYPPNFTYDKNWSKPSVGIFPIPDFTSSLDACFKWLVPKLKPHRGLVVVDFCIASKVECSVGINTGKKKFSGEAHTEGKTPALALCRAIEKLVEEG